jgi:thiamine-phosphate pyrophosphorylase
MKVNHAGIDMDGGMRGLYLVTPDWDDTEKMLAVTEQALQGGAALVQYRHKSAGPDLRRQQAAALLALCRRYRRQLVINDFVELCETLDADGVHVGGTDAAVATVRARLGAGKIVGASCYGDLQLAREAQRAGASYVAFGGFYPSRVKQYPVTTPVGIIAAAKAEIGLPLVVIGGMNAANAAMLTAAGADMVAAISSVYLALEPQVAARQFGALFGD